jgi:hypothetical protein
LVSSVDDDLVNLNPGNPAAEAEELAQRRRPSQD